MSTDLKHLVLSVNVLISKDGRPTKRQWEKIVHAALLAPNNQQLQQTMEVFRELTKPPDIFSGNPFTGSARQQDNAKAAKKQRSKPHESDDNKP